MDAWRQAICDEAVTWLGTKWQHEARIKGGGVDCGQFIIAVYIAAGLVPAFDTGSYPQDWMMNQEGERYLSWVEQYLDPIDWPPKPGDVAAWKYGKCFSHGAIVLDWPNVIHAHRRERGVVYADATKGELARYHLPEGGNAEREVRFYSIKARL